MPEKPQFLKNKNCNDRCERQRYRIISGCQTSDESIHEAFVIQIMHVLLIWFVRYEQFTGKTSYLKF